MNSTSCTVLIVGAGPVGLVLADRLARLGVPLRLIDQKPTRSQTAKATGLQYRVSEILQTMGISEPFCREGISPTAVNIYARDRKLASFRFAPVGTRSGRGAFQPRAIVIPQSSTEDILEKSLNSCGVEVQWNTQLISYRPLADSVETVIRHADGKEEAVTCGWLISCQGAHSSIRKSAGIEFGGKSGAVKFLLADVKLAGCKWNHDENHLWLDDEGTFGVLPLPGADRWRLTFEVSARPDYFATEPSLDLIRKLAAERGGMDLRMIVSAEHVTRFGVEFRAATALRRGRVFLAGDAAHVHSPTAAMGISNGLQDAVNLSWKLGRVIRNGAPEKLLDTYERERLPVIQAIIAQIDQNTNAVFGRSRWRKFIRNNIVFPLLNIERIQRRAFRTTSQVAFAYADTPLCLCSTAATAKMVKIKPGERAPDILFRSSSARSLFDCLQPHRPVVLLGEKYGLRDRQRTLSLMGALRTLEVPSYVVCSTWAFTGHLTEHCLIDEHGEFTAIYGLAGDFLCCIRPDGHVGLVQKPVNLGGLRTYLLELSAARDVARAFATVC